MKRKYIIARSIEVELTPEEVGRAFQSFGSDDQAAALNAMVEGADWWPQQLAFLTAEKSLTPAARRLMELFGEYARETQSAAAAPKGDTQR